ncbi:hypothetical protein B1T48_12770 [Mycobacterium persicum]|nr:hypothetical protein B1T48_12770 [Mycobacterium persicum]
MGPGSVACKEFITQLGRNFRLIDEQANAHGQQLQAAGSAPNQLVPGSTSYHGSYLRREISAKSYATNRGAQTANAARRGFLMRQEHNQDRRHRRNGLGIGQGSRSRGPRLMLRDLRWMSGRHF